jgi:hypothetical protein
MAPVCVHTLKLESPIDTEQYELIDPLLNKKRGRGVCIGVWIETQAPFAQGMAWMTWSRPLNCG